MVDPLYTVFPKPGKLNDVVAYLLTDDEDGPPANRRGRPNRAAARTSPPDIWMPLWSNLAFMAVLLAATSLYVYRRDF